MAAQNNAPLPDGLEIAGYRIVKKIASGGFSIVYLAYDEDGNAVAIKEYLPSSLALRQPGELVPAISPENLPVFRIGLKCFFCLLYTSPSPRDRQKSRMPSSA